MQNRLSNNKFLVENQQSNSSLARAYRFDFCTSFDGLRLNLIQKRKKKESEEGVTISTLEERIVDSIRVTRLLN